MKYILSVIKSLFALYLPIPIIRFFCGKMDFAFIANLRDLSDLRNKTLLERYFGNFYIKSSSFNWPIVCDKIEGVVSRTGRKIIGRVIVCPLTAQQMIEDKELANKKVIDCVRLAERLGAKSVNLAAFTSIVTRDGIDLQGKTNLWSTTGNAYSAVIATENVEKAAQLIDLDLKKSCVAIIGAAGSVGSGCAKYFLNKVSRLILIDINAAALEALNNSLKSDITSVEIKNTLESINIADVIISATSAVSRIIHEEHLKKCAIVVDASHPRNVRKSVILNRSDVIVIHSAIAKIRGLKCNFDFGLGTEEVYGCLAETIILEWFDHIKGNFGGKVELSLMLELKENAPLAGVQLAPFRNVLGVVNKRQLEFVRLARKEISLK